MEVVPKILYFGGVFVEILLRAPYALKGSKIARVERRISASEAVVLVVLSLGSFLIPLVYALSPWIGFANYGVSSVVGTGLWVAGLVPFVASIWVFWRSHRDLGAFWSPSLEIGEGQRLVTSGIYGSIRHPMYASFLLWGIAQPLLLQNWIAGPAGLLVFAVLLAGRVPQEEAMLLDYFGDEYRVYSARTGSIIPRARGGGA